MNTVLPEGHAGRPIPLLDEQQAILNSARRNFPDKMSIHQAARWGLIRSTILNHFDTRRDAEFPGWKERA